MWRQPSALIPFPESKFGIAVKKCVKVDITVFQPCSILLSFFSMFQYFVQDCRQSSTFKLYHPPGIKLLIRLKVGLNHFREDKFKHNFQILDLLCSCGNSRVFHSLLSPLRKLYVSNTDHFEQNTFY